MSPPDLSADRAEPSHPWQEQQKVVFRFLAASKTISQGVALDWHFISESLRPRGKTVATLILLLLHFQIVAGEPEVSSTANQGFWRSNMLPFQWGIKKKKFKYFYLVSLNRNRSHTKHSPPQEILKCFQCFPAATTRHPAPENCAQLRVVTPDQH